MILFHRLEAHPECLDAISWTQTTIPSNPEWDFRSERPESVTTLSLEVMGDVRH
jgi:hypothetical protein